MKDYKTAIVPTLSVKNGMAALAFYKKAFNAVELMRVDSADGLVVAELSIDGAIFFIADESPEHGNLSPITAAGVTARMGLFVANPDEVADKAVAAGATLLYPVADQDYGYRLGAVIDPFGHKWEIGMKLKEIG
ncbi:MAG: VOC family protein [Chitinophagaceae bacterium]